MRRNRYWTSVGLALVLGAQAVASDHPWEVHLFGGGHFSGGIKVDSDSGSDKLDVRDGSEFGLSVGRDIADDSAIEVLWAHQNSQLRAQGGATAAQDVGGLIMDRYQFNGLYFPPQWEGRARWFALGGVGASVFNPDIASGSMTKFTFSLGTGAKVTLSERLGLRFDARWSPTPFNTESSGICTSGPNGGRCFVTASGQLLQQFELTGGVTLRL